MKKVFASIFTLFGMVATALLIGGGAAQANVPPSNCYNDTVGLVNTVICEIDVNDDNVLDGNDIKVTFLNGVLNNTTLNLLANDLDNLTINIGDIDIDAIKDVVVKDVVNVNPTLIVVLPCGCSH